ncbi:MAG TPA: hypothetical protein VMV94_05955, partial [Phycisphaerae bacterium]|nr:hypothetical protein [Phycisphaerae bacterium]
PCGVYDCIRARDPKHTLWQTDTDFHISGSQYVASFTRKGTEPGQDDRLINGNLNGDDWIEILDYALYAARSGTAVPRNTNCSTTGIHADFSGDGLVDTLDFSFVQTYFMFGDEAECCGLALALTQPRTSISVAELDALGLHDLAVSDLNGDGWVDTTDVALFADGQRPHSGPVELGHDDISPTRGTMPVAPHGRSSTGPRRR